MQQVLKAVHLTPSFNEQGRVFVFNGSFFLDPHTLQHTQIIYMDYLNSGMYSGILEVLQCDQKDSVHLLITTQKVTSNVQSVPGQSLDIY
jgi:hypothetical protein